VFLGKVGSLELDPNTYMWKGRDSSFTTTLGRKMLRVAKPKGEHWLHLGYLEQGCGGEFVES
jgi:hypothetical protein